ncbi:MAG TPA: DUF4249 domain-containing protein [Flavipsychrobacter sp.]|nr:DUF4249 domain-containing protein [Flavipsychrobacter sp.]
MKIRTLIFPLSIMLVSCTKNVSTPVIIKNEKDQIVVNGYVAMKKDSSFSLVKVSRTKKLSEQGSPEIIPDQKVFINDEQLVFDAASQIYRSVHTTSANSHYLHTNIDGIEINAEDHFPAPVKFLSVEYLGLDTIRQIAGFESEDVFAKIKLSFQDPVETEDYYQILVKYSDSLTPGYSERFPSNDYSIIEEQVEETDLFGNNIYKFIPHDMIIFRDHYFNGKKKEITLFVSRVSFYQDLYFELHHISKDAFIYHKNVKLQSLNQDNPFAEPTIVTGNIKNAVGFFGCRHIDETNVHVPQ